MARPYLNYAAYFPSKGAIPTLTRCLAVELGTRNPAVRVNCILPGPVLLPPDLPAAEKQQAIDATLVKREGSPEHIMKAVLFFLDKRRRVILDRRQLILVLPCAEPSGDQQRGDGRREENETEHQPIGETCRTEHHRRCAHQCVADHAAETGRQRPCTATRPAAARA